MTVVDFIDLDDEVDYVDLVSDEDNVEGNDHNGSQCEGAAETAASSSVSAPGVIATSSLSMAEPGKGARPTSSSVTKKSATSSSPNTEHQSDEPVALLHLPPVPFPKEFWKAGDYKVSAQAANSNGANCLRIHPKFLHSNATSHRWAFGAIAELLDNAVDEVGEQRASFVKIDKMKYPPRGEYSLVIQDDGGGMSPEDLRRCMSFGFSHKCTDSSIGQYGNGFKSSTMRLGADVIVFSCRQGNSRLTQSIGLLSYTFLTTTGCSDILVPAVDYEFDASSCTLKRIVDHGEKHFSSNLSTLLRWSPFSTEDDLLNQFRDIGCHGTKIVVFNLWFSDEGETELDFTTDDKDIMISGAPKIPQEYKGVEMLNHMHIANRFRYSLRGYASILYLHLPEHFKVILCGRVIEPHHIASDLMYRECIKYRPQVGVSTEVDVVTTIGFLKGAPKLDVYGFNVYHKNRLILPFWPASTERSYGRGIAGVLEANFIRPTHDKQDFEKTGLFQRLETRLKDMAREYRKHNGHLIYYTRRATTKTCAGSTSAKAFVMLDSCSNGGNSRDPLHVGASRDQMGYGACFSTPINRPQQTEPFERRNSCSVIDWRAEKRQNTNGYVNQPAGGVNPIEMGDQNQILKAECSELEATAQQLQAKADSLRNDLHEWQLVLKGLADELQVYQVLGTLQHQPGDGRSYVGQPH